MTPAHTPLAWLLGYLGCPKKKKKRIKTKSFLTSEHLQLLSVNLQMFSTPISFNLFQVEGQFWSVSVLPLYQLKEGFPRTLSRLTLLSTCLCSPLSGAFYSFSALSSSYSSPPSTTALVTSQAPEESVGSKFNKGRTRLDLPSSENWVIICVSNARILLGLYIW